MDSGTPDGSTADAGTDASRDGGSVIAKVDLLIAVDASNSMAEEQAALAAELPRLIETLAAGNADDTDGVPNFPPADLQVGVVTTDLGIQFDDLADTFSSAGCTADGQDAIMRSEPVDEVATSDPDCQDLSISPNFLHFAPGDAIDAFATDFGCLVRVGVEGCFVEQQLEAALKALTPSDSPITFFGDSTGHGNPDGANAGFIREGSLVSVIVVSDEDDCSWEDRRLFDLTPSVYFGGLNARCGLPRNEGALEPLSRYVDGLLDLVSAPELLVFGVIAGIPPDIGDPDAFDTMLGHDDMQVRVMHPGTLDNGSNDWTTAASPGGEPTLASTLPDTDPDVDESQDYDDINDFPDLVPSCLRVVNDRQPDESQAAAFPPRRLVETARDLDAAGAGAFVTSLCRPDPADATQVDLGPAVDDILQAVAARLAGP